MGIFAITSHNHQPEENNDKPSSPQGKDFEGSSSGTSSSTNNAFVTAANAFLSSPLRKISVPVQFYSNSTAPEDPNYDSTKRHLEEAEAASDRRNLFSAVRLPSLSTSKGHHHTVSPIKVQISPAEPAKPNSITSIPSTVRITRRHTEHAGTLRKFTPPLQQPQITFLQPPVIPQVASFPEPIVISRPPPIAEEMEDYDAPSPSVMNGTAIPSLPATHYRFKLPPLQVANATLQSTNRILDSSSGNMVGSPPPKMMTNVNEPIRNKAASFASESPPPVSRYRVFFKCFFVVLFLSIPVVIFVVMMALSGGFAPFNNGTSNKTSASSTTLSPAPFTTFATAVVPTTGHPDTNWLSPGT